ncbi:MAG: folate family ECF transporter S component [Clostridia bacterium]|nr:folate family ECF transporter S component [Clostridia bacterium]
MRTNGLYTFAQRKPIFVLVSLSMLIALQVVLSRFLSIETPFVKIGTGFVPVMLAGSMFGPMGGLIVGGVSDLVGAILFPFGAYFPGFTLTAAFSGLVYGIMLGGKPSIARILAAYLITTVVVTLGFNTLFTAILYVKGEDPWFVKYIASLSTRLTQAAIMLFIQAVFTYLLLNQLSLTERIRKSLRW